MHSDRPTNPTTDRPFSQFDLLSWDAFCSFCWRYTVHTHTHTCPSWWWWWRANFETETETEWEQWPMNMEFMWWSFSSAVWSPHLRTYFILHVQYMICFYLCFNVHKFCIFAHYLWICIALCIYIWMYVCIHSVSHRSSPVCSHLDMLIYFAAQPTQFQMQMLRFLVIA